jgi:hydrogenase-4 component B
MNSLWIILTAVGLLMISGLPAYFGSRHSDAMQRLTCSILVFGSLTGWCGLIVSLLSSEPAALSIPWHLPWGSFSIGLDALSAVFLAPVFTIPALGAVYGLESWRQSQHPENGQGLGLFYGLLTGSMTMVVIARDSVLLLIFWEIMALAAFFLATTEHEKPDVCKSGWIYLVATHTGTLCLLALFAMLRKISGTFALSTVEAGLLTPDTATTLFVLTVIGFGFKAGILPMHAGMIGADADAPGHVSAVLSGVLLKMGVYGIIRMLLLLPASELWNGEVLLAAGAVTGILGAAFAIDQSDIKRLLAYSSVENIGVITLGIGLAMTGRVLQRSDLILLGLGGALLHVWNHSLFKSLLFLNTEAVIRATQTRNMNRMGGLTKWMPCTAGLFLLGAVAVCGLPPLNGFVSEWLLYLGFFQGSETGNSVPFPVAGGAVVLALIGALSLACFVRVFCAVFSGQPRCSDPVLPGDPPPLMRYPLFLLAGGCVVLGVLPQLGLLPILNATAQWMTPTMQDGRIDGVLMPFQWISLSMIALLAVAGFVIALIWKNIRRRPAADIGTWSCGYAQPTPRMQYTATSFGEMLVNRFSWALRPRIRRPVIGSLFPSKTEFSTNHPDTVLRLVLPLFQFTGRQLMKLRLLQQGRTNIYLLYILVILLCLLYWERS